MASVTEHLLLLQKLTQTNLEILQTINESFYTKQNHLYANINDEKIAIPSFIALENKINMLEENFNNLVNSPASGEAYFNIDGNSRAIQVKKYTHTPNSLVLDKTDNFIIDDTNIKILKELLTPAPKVRFNISTIPNDIVYVNVKKIIAKSDSLKSTLKDLMTTRNEQGVEEERPSISYAYSDMHKLLDTYKKDEDYEEFDQLTRLPIRKNVGSGVYVVEDIISDIIDENLDNYITVKIKMNLDDPQYSNNLTYKLFDETIERKLSVGDYLTNYEGTAKLQITEIKTSTNVLVLKVINGEYVNLVGINSYDYSKNINDLSKLRFYSPIDFNEDKYVDITVYDAPYMFVAIAPVDDKMNVQSSWGSGVLFSTYKLQNGNQNLKDYFKNVNNIGKIIENLK
jgi:hypothetical protein